MTKQLEIKNLGAIVNCTVPVPEGGGVVVLSGANGTGKSEALIGVQKMLTGDAKLQIATPTDGYDRGTISGLGGNLTFGRSTRRTGELEVIAMDSRLSVADVVDPQIKDPEAADQKRIKAILAILQVRPDLADWSPLANGDEQVAAQIAEEFRQADDVLILASRVKRLIGGQAAEKERALLVQNALIADLSKESRVTEKKAPAVPPDHATLSANFTAAVNALAELEKQANRAATAGTFREEVERLRGELGDTANLAAALGQHDKTIARLRDELAEVERSRAQVQTKYSAACQAAEQIAKLEAKIENAAAVAPEAMASAKAAVETARTAFADAEATRGVLAARDKLATATTLAATLREQAEAVRKAAQQPDAILAKLVTSRGVGIEIEDGRIRVAHKRGKVAFAELSAGERWRIAMEIAVVGIGPGGLLVLPQEAWEALDPANRDLVADLCVEHEVVILTAEASAAPRVVAYVYGEAVAN